MQRTHPWLLMALAVATIGCRSNSLASRATTGNAPPAAASGRAFAAPAPRKAEGNDLQLVAASSDSLPDSDVQTETATKATAANPFSSLTLPEAISLGLEQNPDIVAQRQADPVSRAALGVARTYPFNPYVQVQATPLQWAKVDVEGRGTVYNYVLLFQTIQLAHQQQYREDAGAAVLNTVLWSIHQAELLNVAQTQRLFFTVLYQRGLRELARASDDNNQQLLRILERQLEAGQATAADVAIVRVDARSTHQQAVLADANYLTALRDFRRQLNFPPNSSIEPMGDLWSFDWRLVTAESLGLTSADEPALSSDDMNGVMARKATSRPDVMAARSDVDVARANLNLATASKTTDLQIGPYYQRTEGGTTYLGFRGQIDLMVIDNRVPLERQRYAEHHQRVVVWRQLEARAALEAQAAWERYEVAFQLAHAQNALDRANLPEELLRLEEQFKANEVDVIRVVQGRTSMIVNQRAQLDLLNELAQAAANLVAAAAIPPDMLLSNPPGSPPSGPAIETAP